MTLVWLSRCGITGGGIRAGIEKYGRVHHREFGKIYAYEVDGFGAHYVMVSGCSSQALRGDGDKEKREEAEREIRPLTTAG